MLCDNFFTSISLCVSREIWSIDYSFFFFSTFLSFITFSSKLSRRWYQACERKKGETRGWNFFPWRLSCSTGFLTSLGLTISCFFCGSCIKIEKLQFLRTARHVERGAYRFFSWPKKNPQSSRLCRVCLFTIDTEREPWCPLNPMTFLQVDFWNS